jgi:hypothetical protein
LSRPQETWRPAYWTIIRSSATHFLTDHAESGAEIYRDRLRPTLPEDLWSGLRSVSGGVARLVQALLACVAKRRPARSTSRQPYLLLVTPGGGKYAREEREVVQACAERGLAILRVHSDTREIISSEADIRPAGDVLSLGDYCRVLFKWLLQCVGGTRWWFCRDRKARSLFAAAIPGMRQRCVDLAFARRIEWLHGRPLAVLTLSPWSEVSVAIVDYMKKHAIFTAGTRTQTTIDLEEHLVINTDVLFCKGVWEKSLYGRLFAGNGPLLVDGCLLSLPLPEEYVLLLGTARRYNQDEEDYRRTCDTLEHVAAASGLPIVYKGHPAQDMRGTRLGGGAASSGPPVVVADLRRNRELIDRASLVVTAHSTLLYQAILSGVPAVIVDVDPPGSPPDEFHESPLRRVSQDQADRIQEFDRRALRDSAEQARHWFVQNYFLEKDVAHLLDYLLERVG